MKQMNGNAQIVEGIRADTNAIGYVGIGYIKDRTTGKLIPGLKTVSLGSGAEALSPLDSASIGTGKYPLLRPLFHYTNGKPTGAVLNFLRFELSEEGQAIVEREGFLRVDERYKKENETALGL